jgi:hypothetical protein
MEARKINYCTIGVVTITIVAIKCRIYVCEVHMQWDVFQQFYHLKHLFCVKI